MREQIGPQLETESARTRSEETRARRDQRRCAERARGAVHEEPRPRDQRQLQQHQRGHTAELPECLERERWEPLMQVPRLVWLREAEDVRARDSARAQDLA